MDCIVVPWKYCRRLRCARTTLGVRIGEAFGLRQSSVALGTVSRSLDLMFPASLNGFAQQMSRSAANCIWFLDLFWILDLGSWIFPHGELPHPNLPYRPAVNRHSARHSSAEQAAAKENFLGRDAVPSPGGNSPPAVVAVDGHFAALASDGRVPVLYLRARATTVSRNMVWRVGSPRDNPRSGPIHVHVAQNRWQFDVRPRSREGR